MARMRLRFITREIEALEDLAENGGSRMPKPSVPQIDRRGGAEGELWRQSERVEGAGALTSEHHRAGAKVLNRETGRVKFNRNIVITGQLTNRNQILNNGRGDQNVT
jgi:hypothetical protein